jgi:hypothetical protein
MDGSGIDAPGDAGGLDGDTEREGEADRSSALGCEIGVMNEQVALPLSSGCAFALLVSSGVSTGAGLERDRDSDGSENEEVIDVPREAGNTILAASCVIDRFLSRPIV